MMTDKQILLQDFLTPAEIEQVQEIFQTAGSGQVAKMVCERIISPNIDRINRKLGQENDPMFLAYACEYVCMAGGKSKPK